MKRKKLNALNVETNLKIDYCSYDACKYAVKHWHYSKCLPAGRLLKYGVWEDEKFIGCIIFSHGATNLIGKGYNLTQFECVELTRIALSKHNNKLSKILSIVIKKFKKKNPNIKLIISYADSEQNHLGIIYQATNWIYTGYSVDTNLIINGKRYHRRSASSKFGTSSFEKLKKVYGKKIMLIKTKPKFKYLYPITKKVKNEILKLSKPYPKNICDSSVTGSTSAFQAGSNVRVNSIAQ